MWGSDWCRIRDLSMDRGAADPRSLRSPCTCGDVHFTHVERFQTLEDSLTNGENSLVYSSVLMCKYLVVCFEAQTSTNHAVGISQSHQHWQLIYVDLDVKFLMFVWVFKQIFISRVVLKKITSSFVFSFFLKMKKLLQHFLLLVFSSPKDIL